MEPIPGKDSGGMGERREMFLNGVNAEKNTLLKNYTFEDYILKKLHFWKIYVPEIHSRSDGWRR